jgi:hypothetical protein
MAVGLAAALLIKASNPTLPWGLNAQEGTVQPAAPPLSEYCAQGRGNPLIIFDIADDLYASVLPLARLRYAAVVPLALPAGPYGMPFSDMGITVTVDQFNNLPRYEPEFRTGLQAWGLNSSVPIATLITARTPEEAGALVAAHPETDFLIPAAYLGAVRSAPQVQVAAAPRLFFLLSRTPIPRTSPPAWTCRM